MVGVKFTILGVDLKSEIMYNDGTEVVLPHHRGRLFGSVLFLFYAIADVGN